MLPAAVIDEVSMEAWTVGVTLAVATAPAAEKPMLPAVADTVADALDESLAPIVSPPPRLSVLPVTRALIVSLSVALSLAPPPASDGPIATATAAAAEVEEIAAVSLAMIESPPVVVVTFASETYASMSLETVLIPIATPTEAAPLPIGPNAAEIAAAMPNAVIVELSLAVRLTAPPALTPLPVVFEM